MKLVAYSLGALETVPMGQVEGRGAAGEFSGCSLQKSDSKSSQKSEDELNKCRAFLETSTFNHPKISQVSCSTSSEPSLGHNIT
jgi:hypothetical protein